MGVRQSWFCLVALAAVEARSLRRAELTLLETYVGRRAGARVIAGQIRRGDTVSLHAAIWFSDRTACRPGP